MDASDFKIEMDDVPQWTVLAKDQYAEAIIDCSSINGINNVDSEKKEFWKLESKRMNELFVEKRNNNDWKMRLLHLAPFFLLGLAGIMVKICSSDVHKSHGGRV